MLTSTTFNAPMGHPLRDAQSKLPRSRAGKLLALALAAAASCGIATAQSTYQVQNILSDGFVPAANTDPNFVNPWGVSIGKDFWINTEATGFDYVALTPGTIPFKVAIPAASGTGTGTPTGTVFNASPNFVLPNGAPASFLFATLDGTLSGWNVGLGTAGSVAQITVNNSAANAVYTDMAILTNPTGSFLLAANFGAGADVEVYDSTFKPAKLTGNFTDPNVPANYAPYSIHTIGSQVFVTYMLRNAVSSTAPVTPGAPISYGVSSNAASPKSVSYQQAPGPGVGLVDVFDINGNFVTRAITGGNLNSPWGVAIAPAGFGIFGGDLLVGNFGDGIINAYDPTTYAFLGQITDQTGKAIANPGLWELVFGTGTTGYGDPNTLYFSAGLDGETHGLFAGMTSTTTSTATPTFGFSASTTTSTVVHGSSAQLIVSAAPSGNFSGTVNLTCSGLPAGATCSFSPSQLTVTPTSPATSMVTIQTSATGTASLTHPDHLRGAAVAGSIVAAMLLPFGSFLAFVRRRNPGKSSNLRLLGLMMVLVISTGIIAGCSSSMTPAASSTPAPPTTTPPPPANPATGLSSVTITATSGSITQTTVVALNVQ